jgi:hypothetical protein
MPFGGALRTIKCATDIPSVCNQNREGKPNDAETLWAAFTMKKAISSLGPFA